MYIRIHFIILVLLTCGNAYAQNSVSYLLRAPSLSPDGSEIAFSYQGDIWKVSSNGGHAERLTVHESYESEPAWDTKGSTLAFTSNRYGNDDIFTLELDGGAPERRTYHSVTDRSPAWTPEGEILFCTRRNFAQVERLQEFYILEDDAATPYRALNGLGDMPSISPNGRYVALTRGSCRITREAYTGPANRDIWLYDRVDSTYTQLTNADAQEIYPDWGDDHTLYFLSAANGRYNVHRLNLADDYSEVLEETAITSFTDVGIRAFDVAANGSTLVMERGLGLYTMSTGPGGEASEVDVQLNLDDKFYDREFETFTRGAGDLALSPNEKYLAFTVRGEIFIKENNKDRRRTVKITNHPYRDQSPSWLNDSTLLFISDRAGQNDIMIARSSDEEDGNLFTTFKREVVPLVDTEEEQEAFYLSPDRSQIVYREGWGTLKVSDIDSTGLLSNERILLQGWDIPEGISWSPDSRWIAYSLEDLDFNEEIYIHPADNSTAGINVSFHPRGDRNPVWSADGSKLGFESIRNNGDSDIWFVWLRKADWEKTQNDWDESDEDEESDSLVEIDFDDIHLRLVQVTSLPGNEGDLQISKDGEHFYFTTNGGSRTGGGGDSDLVQVKWNGEDSKVIKSDVSIRSMEVDEKGDFLYVTNGSGTFSKVKIEGGKTENLPFSAKMMIHYQEERQQIFDEAWRSLRDGFYDPDFHGRDWDALRAYYEPIAMAASTSQDFRDIFNEMLGQLDASHMGLYGDDPEDTQSDRTGRLGVEVFPVTNGVQVVSVLPNSPGDRISSQLMTGDIITAVNLVQVDNETNFYSLLNQVTSEEILLSVTRDGSDTEVVIRPAGSVSSALYQKWVDDRKQLTDQYSNGRLGYIHIQGMNWSSFERFERELAASGYDKEGLVIDVRFNGGGWTTDMLMAVLNVRQHAYTIPRGAAGSLEEEHVNFKSHYPYGERLPLSAWTKPSIAMCNENSYSNAEIFSHAFKTLDLGTLVGMPTFGAVISTGGQRLIDNSLVRMPFRAWYVKATEENMEHGPAVPDIIIQNAPDSKARGEDPQLKAAVDELLRQLDQ